MIQSERKAPSKSQLSLETELSVLKEILRWVKFSGMQEVKKILISTLDDEQKVAAYQLSDGERGLVEVGKVVGIKSASTLSRLWRSWAKLGLGEFVPVMGGERFKRSFDLDDFGIQITINQSEPPSSPSSGQEPSQSPSASNPIREPKGA